MPKKSASQAGAVSDPRLGELPRGYVASEDSPEFHTRMRQAMTVSYAKYGPLKQAHPHKVNALATLKARLALYEQTGNADYLVDCSNMAMIEFMLPAHEQFHDAPTDDGREGRYWHAGGRTTCRRNDGEQTLG